MSKLTKNRPGGPLMGRPVAGVDGGWYDQFGCEIVFNPKDTKYSDLFWSKQPAGVREAIIDNLLSVAGTGLVGVFVSPNGITEDDKERLSAYRVLARQVGYDIGQYRFNKGSGNVTAPITKH